MLDRLQQRDRRRQLELGREWRWLVCQQQTPLQRSECLLQYSGNSQRAKQIGCSLPFHSVSLCPCSQCAIDLYAHSPIALYMVKASTPLPFKGHWPSSCSYKEYMYMYMYSRSQFIRSVSNFTYDGYMCTHTLCRTWMHLPMPGNYVHAWRSYIITEACMYIVRVCIFLYLLMKLYVS